MNLDYEGLALTVFAVAGWARAAEVDGRHILRSYSLLWGCGAGAWTLLCRTAMGHSARQLMFDQIVVVAIMMLAIGLHERRKAERSAR